MLQMSEELTPVFTGTLVNFGYFFRTKVTSERKAVTKIPHEAKCDLGDFHDYDWTLV